MLEAQRRTWKPGLRSRSWLKYPNAWKLLKGLEIRCFTKGNSANLVTRKTGGGGKECPPSSTGNVWNTPKQAQASRENSSLSCCRRAKESISPGSAPTQRSKQSLARLCLWLLPQPKVSTVVSPPPWSCCAWKMNDSKSGMAEHSHTQLQSVI